LLNILASPFLSISDPDGRRRKVTLPGLFASAMRDQIDDLSAVRPHQRLPFYAFLAQVGALALLRSGNPTPPDDQQTWAALLRALTSNFQADEPWALVIEDLSKPALLQPPIPEGKIDPLAFSEFTPDALDYLVTAKNHDVKAARIDQATPEQWFYALLSLQTMDGFLGRGNYGISRMNGGFGSRPLVGLAPSGGIGARLKRDLRRLIDLRTDPPEDDPYAAYSKSGGIGLMWLEPWDGVGQIAPSKLEAFYVEICRRVRLVRDDDRLIARRANSEHSRIASPKEANGVTGDPFAPIDLRDGKKGSKPLTVSASGFDYKLVSQILNREEFAPAPLQEWRQDDGTTGLSVVFSVLARGQGETNGLHERIVPIPPEKAAWFGRVDDPFAKLAKERVDDAGKVRRGPLRSALFVLFQNAPEAVNFGHSPSETKSKPFLNAFDRDVDQIFFPAMDQELSAEGEQARAAARRRWLQQLGDLAHAELEAAVQSVPFSGLRRYTTIEAARSMLDRSFDKHFAELQPEAS
jgi:CRISPR system Cascade subunit CasA